MLEAKAAERRLALIPLTDGERAAIEETGPPSTGCLRAWPIHPLQGEQPSQRQLSGSEEEHPS